MSFNEMIHVSISKVSYHCSQSALESSLLESASCLFLAAAGVPALSSWQAPPGPPTSPCHHADAVLTGLHPDCILLPCVRFLFMGSLCGLPCCHLARVCPRLSWKCPALAVSPEDLLPTPPHGCTLHPCAVLPGIPTPFLTWTLQIQCV